MPHESHEIQFQAIDMKQAIRVVTREKTASIYVFKTH